MTIAFKATPVTASYNLFPNTCFFKCGPFNCSQVLTHLCTGCGSKNIDDPKTPQFWDIVGSLRNVQLENWNKVCNTSECILENKGTGIPDKIKKIVTEFLNIWTQNKNITQLPYMVNFKINWKSQNEVYHYIKHHCVGVNISYIEIYSCRF